MSERFVIVGAGQAGRRAAQTLREARPGLEVVLLGAEPDIPYDRPLLSKAGLVDEAELAKAFIEPRSFYEAQRIDLRTDTPVKAVHRHDRVVELADGSSMRYDKLLLATGSRARRLPVPGADDAKVFHLRSAADARALRRALFPGARIVLIGGGFIGLEIAASLVGHFDARVVVLESAPRLLGRVMPETIGRFVQDIHTAHGVALRFDTQVLACERTRGGTLQVHTGQEVFDCDAVVVGIGVLPNLELAAAAGLHTGNGITVNAFGETDDPAVFAAGDVTSHFNPILQRHVRVESWQVAENQAPVVALRMCGGGDAYAELPWLWSDQYDLNIQTLGEPGAAPRTVVRGQVGAGPFAVVGLDEAGGITGVVTVNAGADMAAWRRLLLRGTAVPAHRLTDTAIPLRELLRA